MQLTIDLTNQPAAYGKRVIAMIEAYYGIESNPHAEDDAYRRGMQATRDASAKVGAAPLAQPAATAPSTVAAFPLPIAPVATQASSPAPSAPQTSALPTAPAATAPTAPAAPTTHASGVQIDKDGLPWDARIHSSSKNINADGTWRKRKGLNDDGLVKRIEGELRAAMAVPGLPAGIIGNSPNTAIVDGLTPNPNLTLPGIEVPIVPLVPTIPVPLAVPAVPTAPPVVPAAAIPSATPTTLPELMPRITSAMIAGTLPNNALLDAVNICGIPDLPTLAHRPDLIPQVWATLQATYPGVLA